MEQRLTIKNYFAMTRLSNKENEYINRYNVIRDKVVVKWYRLKSNSHLVMHFKVPSEKTPKLMYDTLVEFYTTTNTAYSIRNAEIKVFSNCPSYVFMNARVAKNKNMDIDWANGLFNKETLAPPPEDKADKVPTDLRIERGLFFPLYHIKKMSDIDIMAKATGAHKIHDGKALALFIRDSDWVMEKRGQYETVKKMEDKIAKLNPFNKKEKSAPKNTVSKTKIIAKTKSAGAKAKKISNIKKI